MKDIVLSHRNVRMFDNPALFHGSKNQDYGVVYLYDQNYWQANGKSEIQLNFLFDCLKDLDQRLKEKNSQIYVFSGNYLDLLIIALMLVISEMTSIVFEIIF